MPYTSMPAWPNLSDQEVSDLAYFITTFSPDFSNAENVPQPVGAPERAERHERVHRAREEALRGDRLRQVPRHARPGRRTFGANPDGRLGPSDTRGGPRAELDLPGRVVPRGHLQDDEHGVQRHADAVVPRRPARPSSDGRSPTSSSLSRASNGPGYTNLVVAKHVQDPIDLAKGAASFASAPVARFPIVGQIMEPGRAFHPPATTVTVQAIYDAESIALLVRWHDMSAEKTGKNGPSLPVPPEEEEEPRGAGAAAGGGAGRREASSATRKSRRRRPGASRPAGPLCRGGSGAGRPAIRVLRRRRDPDSFAGADGRPQALLHLRRRPELGGSLVLRSGPPRSPAVHRQGKRGHRAQRHGRSHRCRELRPGRMVGHLQAAPSRQPRAPRSRPESSCRSPSRSGTGSRASVATGEVSRSGTPSTSSRKWSHRPSARW